MQDLFAQLERQLGEGDVRSAATLHTIKGSASTVGASALAGRASELEQALRRADGCAAWKSSPASASTNCAPLCDACLLRLQAMFGDAGGVGELNPGAVASPAKDSGGPGARLHPLRSQGE